MLRLLSDENFNGDIVRGMFLRRPDMTLIRVQDAGLVGAADADILAWAAEDDRIVLTHDRSTMPGFAYTRVVNGQIMPGVFVLHDRHPIREAIEELLLIDACSQHAEWSRLVLYLPL